MLPTKVLTIKTDSYEWVEDVKSALAESESSGIKTLIVANEDENGILGLVNCLTKEPGGVNLR